MPFRHEQAMFLISLDELGSAAKRCVLLALCTHADNYTNKCWPSAERIRNLTGLGISTIRRAMDELAEAGYISIEPVPGRVHRTTITLAGAPPIDQCLDRPTPPALGDTPPALVGAPPAAGDELLKNYQEKDASDARAFDDDWQPSNETARKIAQVDNLSLAEIERERRIFVLKAQAGTIPDKPDAAFKVWCARVKGLNHKPATPPPAPAPGPPTVWDRDAKLAHLRRLRNLYERIGKTEDLPALDTQIAAMEASDDTDTP